MSDEILVPLDKIIFLFFENVDAWPHLNKPGMQNLAEQIYISPMTRTKGEHYIGSQLSKKKQNLHTMKILHWLTW